MEAMEHYTALILMYAESSTILSLCLQISRLGKIDVRVSGLGALGWILNTLTSLVDTFFRVSSNMATLLVRCSCNVVVF